MPVSFVNGVLPAVDFETLTVSTVSLGLTAAKILVQTPKNTHGDAGYIDTRRVDEVLITVETNPVRFRLDGTDPTAAVGHLMAAGDSLVVSGYGNIAKLRFIRSGASDGTLMVTYYRKG